MLDPAERARLTALIAEATRVAAPPLTPELRMHQADEIAPIWNMTEAALESEGLAPPFWAFAWPGGQAMARHVLDRPALVAGRRVLAVGCGGGLEALAAARAGAAQVWVNDLDPVALLAASMNAALNGLTLTPAPGEATTLALDAEVILAADVFYERTPTLRLLGWLRARADAGALALAADAGRGFLPTDGLVLEAVHAAPTLRALEDRDERRVAIWRVPPH